MSGAFAVDPDELADLVGALARFAQSLEAVQADVEAAAARAHAGWRGVAADEHAAAQARWRAGIEQVHEGVRTMRSIAATARGNYLAAVHVNRALWARR